MPRFDTHTYIKSLGEELVRAFGRAGLATTPGLKGEARERAVRRKLECLLPGGVGVGTGCVIDSEGKASGQIDVVLYEKEFCPVFGLEDDVSYYPCESVIAVGSVKSTIGKKELRDIYGNIASVRKLKRFVRPARGKGPPRGNVEWRTYLDKMTRWSDGDWETIQNSCSATQIYGFGLGQEFGARPERMIEHTKELYGEVAEELRPNVVLTLDQKMIAPASGVQMSYSALGSPGVTFVEPENSLEYLLVSLFSIIQNGMTSSADAFERYVVPPPMKRSHTFVP